MRNGLMAIIPGMGRLFTVVVAILLVPVASSAADKMTKETF
jgi:hypothetical protein